MKAARRTVCLRAVCLCAALVLAGPPAGAAVAAERVLTLPGIATAATHAGDGRLFVTLIDGRVLVVENGEPRPGLFLDLGDRVDTDGRGLWSLAFHPDRGFVFAHYAERESGDSIVARYRLSEGGEHAERDSEAILLRIPKATRLHYGGQLHFGPDGHLYVSTGDGTGREGVGPDPSCSAQSLDSLEGKLLRLDVDVEPDAVPPYRVPPDNPFVGAGRGEIWAYGLRNPWRFSFDRETGDLWLTDVGQNRREEIDFQPAASAGGENYGWKVMEGGLCFGRLEGCGAAVPACGDPSLVTPILEYGHENGRCSVIGGYVYRGSRVPELRGRYLYGDFCSGEVWAAERAGGTWRAEALPVSLPGLASFAEDAAGEIWLLSGDGLYRLTDPDLPEPGVCTPGPTTLCLGADGRFRAEIEWADFEGGSGAGRAFEIGLRDSGLFYFFSEDNIEMLLKVLDACSLPGFESYWVFYAATTNLRFELTVTDTRTGAVQRYSNPLGQAAEPVLDTAAFDCP